MTFMKRTAFSAELLFLRNTDLPCVCRCRDARRASPQRPIVDDARNLARRATAFSMPRQYFCIAEILCFVRQCKIFVSAIQGACIGDAGCLYRRCRVLVSAIQGTCIADTGCLYRRYRVLASAIQGACIGDTGCLYRRYRVLASPIHGVCIGDTREGVSYGKRINIVRKDTRYATSLHRAGVCHLFAAGVD